MLYKQTRKDAQHTHTRMHVLEKNSDTWDHHDFWPPTRPSAEIYTIPPKPQPEDPYNERFKTPPSLLLLLFLYNPGLQRERKNQRLLEQMESGKEVWDCATEEEGIYAQLLLRVILSRN